ncbi:MAG: hypothetical protein ABJB49_02345 [Nitrospirota bacterium]
MKPRASRRTERDARSCWCRTNPRLESQAANCPTEAGQLQMISVAGLIRSGLLPLLFLFAIVSTCGNGANKAENVPGNDKNAVGICGMNKSTNVDFQRMIPPDLDKSPSSDWIGMPLSKMIGTSELIVYGSVKKVLDSTIQFQIMRKIAGGEKENIIEMIKAKPDPFADVKPAPYQAGQCYLLFLFQQKNTGSRKQWKMMGHPLGQEGQMPVIESYIYFKDRYFDGIPLKRYKVNGVEQNIQRFEFSLFLNAIEGYKKSYKWVKRAKDNNYLPEKIRTDEQIDLYAKKSFMHRYLVTETRNFISSK